MALANRSIGPVEVVSLSGSLDAAVAPELRTQLKELIASGRSRIVLDLGEVGFVDSSGLSVLVSTLKAVRAADGDLVLLNLSPEVRSIVELTRLHRILEIFSDEEAAIAKASGRYREQQLDGALDSNP